MNLHDKFPEFDLDTLLKILDSIVETSDLQKGTRYPSYTPWYQDLNRLTCTYKYHTK